VAGAASYRLQTRSERPGQTNWQSWGPVAGTDYTFVFDAFPDYFNVPGTVYFWRVLALDAGNQPGPESATWRFIFQRKSVQPTPPPPPDPTKAPTPPPP